MPLHCDAKIFALTYHILVTCIAIVGGGPGSSILFASAAAVGGDISNSITSNLTSEAETKPRISKQIDRTDALLAGFNAGDATELPLHEPTGEKSRKTYDFTSKVVYFLVCHLMMYF